MNWFLDLSTRGKLVLGFGLSIQNTAGARRAETVAQQLHELGRRLKQLTPQY